MSSQTIQDLRHGLRALAAKPGFTLVALLTLALGIGANTAIFSVVKAVVIDPLPYAQADRLVSLAQANTAAEANAINVGYLTYVDWRRQLHGVDAIAVFADWQASIASEGDAQMLAGMRVSPQYFDVFGVAPILGRTFTDEEDQSAQRNTVVVSAGLWQRELGGAADVIGRKLRVNGRERTIVGVLPASFQPAFYGNVAAKPEIWLPLGYRPTDPEACRDCLHLQAVARLAPQAGLSALRAELAALAARLVATYPQSYPPTMRFVAAPLQNTLTGSATAPLWLLFAAAGLVLLIACVDVGHLVLVRAQARERELAIRHALGARRGRLARLLFTEALLLALGGGMLALLVAWACTQALLRYAGAALPRLADVTIDGRVLAFSLLVSIGVAVLTGLWPALRASRPPVEAALHGTRGAAGMRTLRAQSSLSVAQLVLAFVLAIGALLVLRSFAGLVRVDPGFDARDLTAMNLSAIGPRYNDEAEVARFYERLVAGLRAVPGVAAASIVSPLPLSGNYDRAGFHVKDRPIPPQQAPEVDRYVVSPGHFAAMGIPLLRGRDFAGDDRAGSAPVAIVSATLAQRQWPGEDALGKQIQLGGRDDAKPWATVVGVVGDVRQYGLDVAPTAQAYLVHAQASADPMALLVRSPLPAERIAAAVRAVVHDIDPANPVYAVAPMQQRIADTLERRRLTMTLFCLFALTALSLAALGIYGVVASTVAQQTPALGVRRALGASDARVWQWVLGRSATHAALGMLIGVPLALAWGRLLAHELVGIGPYDAASFAIAAAVLVAVVFAASLGPARRALNVAPVVALRQE